MALNQSAARAEIAGLFNDSRDKTYTPDERREFGRQLAVALRAQGLPVSWDPDCTGTCASNLPGEPFPPHDAMPNCQSGGHAHCACDGCF